MKGKSGKRGILALALSFILIICTTLCDLGEANMFAKAETSNEALGIDVQNTNQGAIAVTSGDTINVTSGDSIDVTSGGSIGVTSGGSIDVTSGGSIDVTSGGSIDVTSGGTIEVIEPQPSFQTTTPGAISYSPYWNTYVNPVTSNVTPSGIEYSIVSGGAIATINSKTGVVIITAPGVVTVNACVHYKNHDPINIQYSLEIVKAEQTNLKFAQNTYYISYGQRNVKLVPTGNVNGSTITYSLDKTDFINIDQEGNLTFIRQNSGIAKLTAHCSGNKYYQAADATCFINVSIFPTPDKAYRVEGNYDTKLYRPDNVAWYTSNVKLMPKEGYLIGYTNQLDDSQWGEYIEFSNEGKNQTDFYLRSIATGAVTPKISSSDVYIDKSNPIVDVDYSKPFLMIPYISLFKDLIEINVTAKDTDSAIKQIEYEFKMGNDNIKVIIDNNKATFFKNGFIFKTDTNKKLEYSKDDKTANYKIIINEKFKSIVKVLAVNYAGNNSMKTSENTLVFDADPPIITVTNNNNENFNGYYYNKARTASIKIEEDNFYKEDVIIKKYSRANANEEYVISDLKPDFQKTGSNTYSTEIVFDHDGEYKLEVAYSDKCENQAIPFNDHFVIDTVKPELAVNYKQSSNSNTFFNNNVDTSISIKDELFDLNQLEYEVKATDFTNTAYDLTALDKYIKDIGNWVKTDNTYTLKTLLNYEGEVSLAFKYLDKANNQAQFGDSFHIDTKAPTDLSVTYSNPVKTKTQSGTSHLYYKDDITVTLSGKDIGGIEALEYQLINEVSHTTETVTVEKKDIIYSKDGATAEYQFKISKDFKGKIEFYVVDRAGNKSTYQDQRMIVLDKTAPSIGVNFSDDNSKEFYNSARTATVTIEELNFEASDVRISVTSNNSQVYGQAYSIGAFSNSGISHSCTVDFTSDGEYVLDVSYTDNSGNAGKSYVSKRFYIDRKSPVVNVSYDNNDVYNGYCFNTSRKATITVDEKNFNNSQFFANITLKDKDGNVLNDESIHQQLSSASSWTDSGETHTLCLNFTKEGIYEVSFSCNDKAGNANNGINYGSSVATNKFFIDKTKPTGSITIKQFNKVWNQLLLAHNYNLYSNKVVEIELVGEDTLSGVGDIAYYKSNTTLSEEQLKQIVDWQVLQTNKFYLVDQDKCIIYGRIRDKVNNITYLSSDGMIIDYEAPSIEQVAPSIQLAPVKNSTSGIYNQDVGVNVNIKDVVVANDVYSGLKVVSYEVFSLGEMTQSGILYEAQEVTLTNQSPLKEWSKNNAIIVDKAKNNSNEVEVRVKAIDFSGNVSTKSLPLKIDITEPEIKVVYDNNQQDTTFETYFKENRTATITVKERNFDPSLVQITLKNIDGSQVPAISEWKKSQGSRNLDDTTYVATIKYQENGHYQFNMSLTDMATNKNADVQYMNSVCTNDFILDKTIPQIEFLYDNNNVHNQNYYKADRTVTIVIKDHNFDASRVELTSTLTKSDKSLDTLKLGAWSTNGDTHTATVKCSEDGFYQLRCDFTDKAGNKVESAVETKFFVDQTKPVLTIEGVENLSANSGRVAPIITYSDVNLDNQKVAIQLVGQRQGKIELKATQTDIVNGRKIELKDFEKIPGNDDYYTLTVNLSDKAGNESTKTIEFSINRFGSTYKLSSSASKINGSFLYSEEDIVLSEINVDPIDKMDVILYKNNQTIPLVKGVDYVVSQKYLSSKSYDYEYVISKSNFKEDGVYRIVIQSTDKAGNVSLSNTEEKNLEISFGVDKTNPIIIVTNLESDKTYSAKQLSVNCLATDNLKVETITVMLDGKELTKWDKPTGEEVEFMIPGDSTKPHTLQIVATDAAGNSTTEEMSGFYVTTNKWVQYRNNKVLFYGSIGGFGTIAGGTIATVIIRKKRKLRIRTNS